MAKSMYSVPVSEVFGEDEALATTLAFGDIINVRSGFKGLQFYCASAFEFLTTPRIGKVILYDASTATYYDQTTAAIDNDADTEVNLGTMTTTDILYVGAVDVFLGLSIDVGTVNANTVTTLTVEYWDGGAWVDFSGEDDGTDAANTLAQDGLYTWTLPTNWHTTSVNGSVPLYYMRFYPAGTLTAGTSFDRLITINKGTDYAYFAAAMVHDFNFDEDVVGGLQFLSKSGTPTLFVNHIKYKG